MIYMLTVKVSRVYFHRDLSFLGMIVSELTDEMVRVRIKSTLSPYIPLVKVLSFAPSSSGCEQISFAITLRGGDSAPGRRDVGQIREWEAGGWAKIRSGRREVGQKFVVGGGRLGKNGSGRRDAGQK